MELRIPRSVWPLATLLALWPLLHLALIGYLAWEGRWGWAIAVLYLLPPLVCRFWLAVFGRPRTPCGLWSKDGLIWWGTSQFQQIFNRFPALEEVLRLAPVVYTNWLRLWGAKIGRRIFWSPRVWILDRPFLEVGDNAVLGAASLTSSHLLKPAESGGFELVVAPVRIGRHALLGGFGGLSPGTQVFDNETLPSTFYLAPFYLWKDGRRRAPPAQPHQ